MEKSKFYKKYLPSIVYGGSDGAVSYFTLMAGAYGAGLSIRMLIAIGVSNIFADAFSMATADYLSEDSRKTDLSLSKTTKIFTFSPATKSGVVTFFSFLTVGFFPLAPSIYAYFTVDPSGQLPFDIFIISIAFTILAFIYIGFIRGAVLGRNRLHTIAQSLIICSISAVVAYYLGEWVAGLLK